MEEIMDEAFKDFLRAKRILLRQARQAVSVERESVSGTGNSRLGDEVEMLTQMIQVKIEGERGNFWLQDHLENRFPGRTYHVIVSPSDFVALTQSSDYHICKIRRDCK